MELLDIRQTNSLLYLFRFLPFNLKHESQAYLFQLYPENNFV